MAHSAAVGSSPSDHAALFTEVADTARWVAACRAQESQRPDALVHDPYAGRLAGPRGERLARALPASDAAAWSVAVRTREFDDLICAAVERDRIGAVLNLGAGLDTRPYRLPLPRRLRWVEVDLPAVLADKDQLLALDRPRCQLERVALDLSDAPARRELFARVGAGRRDVLVVTEGLLLYLPPRDVADLASELAARPRFRLWLLDLLAPPALTWFQLTWGLPLATAGIRPRFAPVEGLAFFEKLGWRAREFRSLPEQARRLGREWAPLGAWCQVAELWLPNVRNLFRDAAGCAVLERPAEGRTAQA